MRPRAWRRAQGDKSVRIAELFHVLLRPFQAPICGLLSSDHRSRFHRPEPGQPESAECAGFTGERQDEHGSLLNFAQTGCTANTVAFHEATEDSADRLLGKPFFLRPWKRFPHCWHLKR